MRRRRLFQFKDQTWLPRAFREALASFHAAQHRVVKSARAFASIVDETCAAAGTTSVVDLASGEGGPFLVLARQLRAQAQRPWHFVLTDQTPDRVAADRLARRGDEGLRYELSPIDATRLPEGLSGVRTFVSSFHSLEPLAARAALRDAFDRRQAVCIFELTKNARWPLLTVLAVPALLWGTTLASPRRPKAQLFFTFICPILPLLAAWDAFVAHRRTYTRDDYLTMTADLRAGDYRWQLRRVRVAGLPYATDCLIGLPVATSAGQTRGVA